MSEKLKLFLKLNKVTAMLLTLESLDTSGLSYLIVLNIIEDDAVHVTDVSKCIIILRDLLV